MDLKKAFPLTFPFLEFFKALKGRLSIKLLVLQKCLVKPEKACSRAKKKAFPLTIPFPDFFKALKRRLSIKYAMARSANQDGLHAPRIICIRFTSLNSKNSKHIKTLAPYNEAMKFSKMAR